MQNAQRIEVEETCAQCGHWRPAHLQEWGSRDSCSLCGCQAWEEPVDTAGWGNPWDGMTPEQIAGPASNKKKISARLARALKPKKIEALAEELGWE
jgi:hypothetical protein